MRSSAQRDDSRRGVIPRNAAAAGRAHRLFAAFILICILASSLALAIEDPYNTDSKRNDVLNIFDIIFTTIFGIEMVIKVRRERRRARGPQRVGG